jgi:23S rRNA maturation mini-RNase III
MSLFSVSWTSLGAVRAKLRVDFITMLLNYETKDKTRRSKNNNIEAKLDISHDFDVSTYIETTIFEAE